MNGPARRPIDRLFAPVDIAWLVFFRIAFGLLMLEEAVRYPLQGLARSMYIEPVFHFTYFGFEWVKPWPGAGMYIHFAAQALLALGVAAGAFYRLSSALYFLAVTYVFLLDESRYLNHYYLICLIAFLMPFLPAHRALSVDCRRRPSLRSATVPAWTLWLLRAQIGIVYLYAGIAKLHGDWLQGEPMRLWLASRSRVPIIGPLLIQAWFPYLLSYGGILIDLLSLPLLLWRRTRAVMFCFLLAFHGMNCLLFDIGVFPWMMVAATLVFFEPDWPRRLAARFRPASAAAPAPPAEILPRKRWLTVSLLAAYLLVQLLVPLRHWLYPGDVHWTEEGHRFSWRMKLRSKDASARFTVRDPPTQKTWTIQPELPPSRWRVPWAAGLPAKVASRPYLSPRQARKMAGLPDMILQFAHHLAERFREAGYPGVEVRARVLTSLNGRRHQLLVDPDVDLAAEPRSLLPARWIVPLAEPLYRDAASGSPPEPPRIELEE